MLPPVASLLHTVSTRHHEPSRRRDPRSNRSYFTAFLPQVAGTPNPALHAAVTWSSPAIGWLVRIRRRPFDAHDALTWSCNTYFAAVARSLTPGELGRLLRPTGLLGPTALFAPEATADFHEPRTIEEEQLTVLGVTGIRVTPLELATAYRWLALEMISHPDSVATRTVEAGLRDSAKFGMAGEANVGDISIAGKTGTAEGAITSRTHGWFVGFAPAQKPRAVIAIYLSAAHGADAARIAGVIFANAPLEH